jgi:Flp pilus assembly protein TadD
VAALLFVRTRHQVALWKDTKTLFTETLRVNPENAIAHNCLGAALLHERQEDAAIREFEIAMRITPSYIEPYMSLGAIMHRRGRDADAIRYYEPVRNARPDDTRLAAAEALSLLGVGRFEEAVRLYRQVLALQPDDIEALLYLGIVRGFQGHPDEALTLLHRADVLAPKDPAVQHALGKAIYLSNGPAAETIEHLRRSIQYKPDWAAPYGTLAMVLSLSPDTSARDADEAVRLATRGVELTEQRDPDALAALAVALAAQGRFDAAVTAARQALAQAEGSKRDSLAAQIRSSLATYQAMASSVTAHPSGAHVRPTEVRARPGPTPRP